jgi:hypothetical protein
MNHIKVMGTVLGPRRRQSIDSDERLFYTAKMTGVHLTQPLSSFEGIAVHLSNLIVFNVNILAHFPNGNAHSLFGSVGGNGL